MTENDIKGLMEKYLNGTITAREEKLLEQFDGTLLSKNEKVNFKSEVHKAKVRQNLSQIIHKKGKTKSFKWLRVAASWALVIGFCVVVYNWSDEDVRQETHC